MNQAFRDWECIVGVETSSDNTEDIVREYVAKDSRFTMFTAARSGSASASRNSGIDLTRGEYIIFLDGDDTIIEGSLQRLHEQIAACPDRDLYPCALVEYNDLTGETGERYDNFPQENLAQLSGPEAMMLALKMKRKFTPGMYLAIFRHDFLLDNNLQCIYGIKGEDYEFMMRAYYWANTVMPLHEVYYRYRINRPTSAMMSTSAEQWLSDAAVRFKSLFSFHSAVRKQPDFPPQLTLAWGRMWITDVIGEWFAPTRIKTISRRHRLETLHSLFTDGFEDFFALANTYRSGRIAGRVVYAFVRFPCLRWACELFFRGYYSQWFNLHFRKWYEKWFSKKI